MILPGTGFSLLPDSKYRFVSAVLGVDGAILSVVEAHDALFLVPYTSLWESNFRAIVPRNQPIFWGPPEDPRPLSCGWSANKPLAGGRYFSDARSFRCRAHEDCPVCKGEGTSWSCTEEGSGVRKGGCNYCGEAHLLARKWIVVGRCRETGFEWVSTAGWTDTRAEARRARKEFRKDNEYATYRVMKSEDWRSRDGHNA